MSFKPSPKMTERQVEKAVNMAAAEFERKVIDGVLLDSRNMTLQEFYYKWLDEYAKISLEPTTAAWYAKMFENKILPSLGHLKLANIKPLHIQTFCNNLTKEGAAEGGKAYSPTSVKRYHAAISSLLGKAVEWDLISVNPAKKVSLPKQKTAADSVNCFTPEQAIIFLNALNETYAADYKAHTRVVNGKEYRVSGYKESRAIPTQFKVLFNIAIYGGLRRGELLALTWKDIDFKSNAISVNKAVATVNNKIIVKPPKNKTSERIVSLPDFIMNLLRFYKVEQYKYRLLLGNKWQREDYLFIQWNGKIMNPSTPYHTMKDVIEKYNASVSDESLKLPSIRFHDLRHTSATLLIAANVDIKTVSSRLGHAQTSTTMNIYAHSYKKLDEIAADALGNVLNNNPEKQKIIEINPK